MIVVLFPAATICRFVGGCGGNFEVYFTDAQFSSCEHWGWWFRVDIIIVFVILVVAHPFRYAVKDPLHHDCLHKDAPHVHQKEHGALHSQIYPFESVRRASQKLSMVYPKVHQKMNRY